MSTNRIFIDGLGLVEGHFSGVGQYILGILTGLDELLDQGLYDAKEIPEIFVVIPRDTVGKYKQFGFKHLKYKVFPLSFRYMSALWHRGWLPPIDIWCGRGVYIFPRFVDMPLLFSKSAALVIFDLSYELYRQYSDEGNADFLSKGVRASIKRTNKIIAISQNAKKEIMSFYNQGAEDVLVATPATDPNLFYRRSVDEITEVKRKYGIKGDYILALSNLEPRKNLGALAEAYCRLPKAVTEKLSLLLVGVSGWKTDELFKDILKRVDAGYNIIRPAEYVSDIDKPAIISGAKLLVYPSHYEGFGMPPLEALACGVPVIAANNSSIPEVVGNTSPLIDSNDINDLYSTMLKSLEDIDALSKKAIINGPLQAEKFSWVTSAKVFLEAAGVPWP